MVLDAGLRHMPLRTLSLFAQRTGKVFVSVTTWTRLVRVHGWRRPCVRVHPAKPTLGIRANRPNEYWHIDVTVLKLLDGTKTFLHAVIDNCSRKILAWTLAPRLDPTTTCQVRLATYSSRTSSLRIWVRKAWGGRSSRGSAPALRSFPGKLAEHPLRKQFVGSYLFLATFFPTNCLPGKAR
jgi:transposase InsO family protein